MISMTEYGKFFGSYLKTEDIKKDTVLTVKDVKTETFGKGDDANTKIVLYFKENNKGLALNKKNAEAVHEVSGQKEIEKWVGAKITIFVDPAVEYMGEKVGGLRIRRPDQGVSQEEKPEDNPKDK